MSVPRLVAANCDRTVARLRHQRRRRLRVAMFGVALVVAIGVAAGLMLGETEMSGGELLRALLRRGSGGRAAFLRMVVWEWRMPRVVAAVVIGVALASSGYVFQTVTRNPLGSPDLLGVTGGATVGAALAAAVTGRGIGAGSSATLAAGALLGAAVAMGVVAAFSIRGSGGLDIPRLLIAGISISAMAAALTAFVLYAADRSIALAAASWSAGALGRIEDGQAVWLVVAVLPSSLVIASCARPLRHLQLGAEVARSLGVRVGAVRVAALTAAVALAAVTTAVAGPIPFVAMVAPQLTMRLAAAPSLALSALVGAALLLAADLGGQYAFGGVRIPAGVLTGLLGGGYLGWLLLAGARR